MKIEKSSINAFEIVKEQLANRILECGGFNKQFVHKYFSIMQQIKNVISSKLNEDDLQFEGAIYDNGLCGIDCSMFDMSELSQEEFEMIPFDTNTIFSEEQINKFHPSEVLERGKQFGLGLDKIDTDVSGMHIAIKDQSFDYRTVDIKLEEYVGKNPDSQDNEERYHGKTVTSLMASNSCGVAKNAKVHFFSGKSTVDILNNIINKNKEHILNNKKEECIRVISISQNLNPKVFEEYKKFLREVGCELICANNYNLDFHAFRNGTDYTDTLLLTDEEIKEITESFGKSEQDIISQGLKRNETAKSAIKIPINRTYHQIGKDSECYKYQSFDSTSWGIPQVAGLIAVFKKQKPDLTYEEFVDIAKATSKGKEHIIDPIGIQEELTKRISRESHNQEITLQNVVKNALKRNNENMLGNEIINKIDKEEFNIKKEQSIENNTEENSDEKIN